MKLSFDPRLPQSDDMRSWRARLTDLFRDIAQQVNQVSEGSLQGTYNALAAAPTQGTYRAGDFIRNSAIAEAGTAGAKYIITGWYCSVGGTPGTWLQARVLTGN
jgi:hypothetical protein